MSAKTDYTPLILAQLTDLSTRVTQLEAANAALRAEVSRLGQRGNGGNNGGNGGNGFTNTSTPPPAWTTSAFSFTTAAAKPAPAPRAAGTAVQMSIPLASSAGHLGPRQTTENPVPPRRQGPVLMNTASSSAPKEYKPLTIQDVLHLNETVAMEVGIGKDDAGNFLQATCFTVFDGVSLTVTACEHVPALVGMSTTKPGEILYRFIEDLKNNGLLKKPFTIAPWRLCFVVRDGKKMSLEDLRG
jgi:hypothetical protein